MLSPFFFVSLLVSLRVGHCVRFVSLLLPFVFLRHCVRPLSLLFPFVSLLVSLLVGHCVRLVSLLFPFVSLLVSILVCHCVRLVSLLFPFVSLLVSLLVDVSKRGLGNASLLSHLFGVYGGVILIATQRFFSQCSNPRNSWNRSIPPHSPEFKGAQPQACY